MRFESLNCPSLIHQACGKTIDEEEEPFMCPWCQFAPTSSDTDQPQQTHTIQVQPVTTLVAKQRKNHKHPTKHPHKNISKAQQSPQPHHIRTTQPCTDSRASPKKAPISTPETPLELSSAKALAGCVHDISQPHAPQPATHPTPNKTENEKVNDPQHIIPTVPTNTFTSHSSDS